MPVVVLLLSAMLPCLENPEIEMRPFSPHFSPASTSPVDPYRHWKRSDRVRRASVSATDRGGAMRPCRLIVILAVWPILADSAGVVLVKGVASMLLPDDDASTIEAPNF